MSLYVVDAFLWYFVQSLPSKTFFRGKNADRIFCSVFLGHVMKTNYFQITITSTIYVHDFERWKIILTARNSMFWILHPIIPWSIQYNKLFGDILDSRSLHVKRILALVIDCVIFIKWHISQFVAFDNIISTN